MVTNNNKLSGCENPNSKRPQKLLKAASDAANNAYSPYSGFLVGAAVETSDGRIFVGANMENVSYGLTVCAEVGALQSASTANALDKIQRIAIVGGLRIKALTPKQSKPTAPCGRCRQLISEAAMLSGYDIEVWYADLELKSVKCKAISELLPDSFGASSLKKD